MNIIMNQRYEPLALFSKNIIPCLLFICIRVFLCFYLQKSMFPYGPRIERVFFLLSCHRAPTWPSLPPGTTQCGTGRAFLIPHSVPAASCRCLFCLKTYTANNCRETGWESYFVRIAEVPGRSMSCLPHTVMG